MLSCKRCTVVLFACCIRKHNNFPLSYMKPTNYFFTCLNCRVDIILYHLFSSCFMIRSDLNQLCKIDSLAIDNCFNMHSGVIKENWIMTNIGTCSAANHKSADSNIHTCNSFRFRFHSYRIARIAFGMYHKCTGIQNTCGSILKSLNNRLKERIYISIVFSFNFNVHSHVTLLNSTIIDSVGITSVSFGVGLKFDFNLYLFANCNFKRAIIRRNRIVFCKSVTL